MEFLQNILRYYHSESNSGIIAGGLVSVLLLVAGFFSRKLTGPFSLLRGLTWPLLIGGFILGIAGLASGFATRKEMAAKVQLYRHSRPAFFKQEVAKVGRIHKGWFGVRLVWGVVGAAGAVLLFSAKRKYWMGVGLGMLLYGVTGQVIETFSYHRNERYRREVLEEWKRLGQPASTAVLNLPPPAPALPAWRDSSSRVVVTWKQQRRHKVAASRPDSAAGAQRSLTIRLHDTTVYPLPYVAIGPATADTAGAGTVATSSVSYMHLPGHRQSCWSSRLFSSKM